MSLRLHSAEKYEIKYGSNSFFLPFTYCSKLTTVYVPSTYTDPLDSFCETTVTVTKTSELD